MTELTSTELRRLRAHAQLLADRPIGTTAATVAEVVQRVVAVQAQALSPSRLAVRARSAGLTAADVENGLIDRSLVSSWLLRGTLHLVAATDYHWLQALVDPELLRTGWRRRLELGLTEPICERGAAVLEQALAPGDPLTRVELMTAVVAAGVPIDPTTQAAPHLLGYAAALGLICRGPHRRSEPTYVRVREWLPPAPVFDRLSALAELARRYLTGYGPATVADLRTWSGLPAADAHTALAALAGEVRTVRYEGRALLTLPLDGDLTPPPPRLLGAFDTLLLGYQGRELFLHNDFRLRIQNGGIIAPAILVDGEVAGTWRVQGSGRRQRVELDWFAEPKRSVVTQLAAEIADVVRFLGV